ncbi:bacteriohemerythrin [Thermostilla marina]
MTKQWSDDYLLGIETIDSQHKQFFDAAQRLHDAMVNVEGEDVVEKAVDFLRSYAQTHFQTEEALMERHGYPRLEEHKRLHAAFFDAMTELVEDLEKFGPNQHLAEQALEISRDWLLEHILEEDTQYAKYIR